MEGSNMNKPKGRTIPLHLFENDHQEDPHVEPIRFLSALKMTGEELRKKFNITDKPNCRLFYNRVPIDEAEVIAEIEIFESAEVNLNEVKNFVVRHKEEKESVPSASSAEQSTEPSDPSTIKQTDLYKEGITITTFDLKKSTLQYPSLKPLQVMDVEHSPDFIDEHEACSNPKLLKCLFKHSTGNVYLASSESHQQLIVKEFYTNSLKLLANETKVYNILKGLSCIPKVISVSTEHSLGLEYVKGQHYCKPQTLDDVLQYMILLLKALQDIHSRGVIHGDIKFANVIYEPQQPLMKVIDFSYSAIAVEQFSLVHCTGYTERYAAPEVLELNCVGFESDVFSAGIMFTALLYGTKIGEEDYQFFQRLVNEVENRFRCTEASLIAKAMLEKDWRGRITVSETVEKMLKLQPSLEAFMH